MSLSAIFICSILHAVRGVACGGVACGGVACGGVACGGVACRGVACGGVGRVTPQMHHEVVFGQLVRKILSSMVKSLVVGEMAPKFFI